MSDIVKNLIVEYKKKRPEIKKRLAEFHRLRKGKPENIFSEVCYCILTANANAMLCDQAIKELKDRGLLLKGSARQISSRLKGRARFHNKKADYIVRARGLFKRGQHIDVKGRLNINNIFGTRNWLVENIKGFGYKEASHFLRNIGLGRNIAILDRHVLRNLKKYGIINRIPSSIGARASYMAIEDKMRRFSKRTGIPLEEMDLLFWSLETGFVFK